jgi:ABC-type molybdenum transport system ATPase subunit/photorepair protein PhrA
LKNIDKHQQKLQLLNKQIKESDTKEQNKRIGKISKQIVQQAIQQNLVEDQEIFDWFVNYNNNKKLYNKEKKEKKIINQKNYYNILVDDTIDDTTYYQSFTTLTTSYYQNPTTSTRKTNYTTPK